MNVCVWVWVGWGWLTLRACGVCMGWWEWRAAAEEQGKGLDPRASRVCTICVVVAGGADLHKVDATLAARPHRVHVHPGPLSRLLLAARTTLGFPPPCLLVVVVRDITGVVRVDRQDDGLRLAADWA